MWTDCYDSATRLFGASTGDAIADRIREAVQASPSGLTKTQIRRLFSGHIVGDRIDAALHQLATLGVIASYNVSTRGRPAHAGDHLLRLLRIKRPITRPWPAR